MTGYAEQPLIEGTRSAYFAIAGGVAFLSAGFLLVARFAGGPDHQFSLEGILTRLTHRHPLDSVDWEFLLQLFADLQIIILVWHANVQHVIAFKLRNGVLDSVIQFVFCVPEFFLIRNSDPGSYEGFMFSFVALCGWAILAYSHLTAEVFWIPRRDAPDGNLLMRQEVGLVYPLSAIILISIAGTYAAVCARLLPLPIWLGRVPVQGWQAVLVVNVFIIAFWLLFGILFWRKAKRALSAEEIG